MRDLEQVADLLLAVAHALVHIAVVGDLVEVAVVLDLVRHVLDLRGVLHLHHEGARQRILAVERREGLLGVGGHALEVAARVILGLVLHRRHVLHVLQLVAEGAHLLVGGVVGDVDVDGDLLLDVADHRGDHGRATMNRPMMNRDRKIVMTAPSDVVRLRAKWLPASLSEYPRLLGAIVAVPSPLLVADHVTGLERDDAAVHGIDHLAVVRGDDDRRARAVDALQELHDTERDGRIEVARGLVADKQRAGG